MSTWERYSKSKILHPERLEEKIVSLRCEKKTIATLNGSFDLLHAGHLYMLFEASKTADILIVALNTDRSIQRYKGEGRPIISLPHRIELLTAIGFVDYVTWFDESDPRALLKQIQPNVHVNGEEYGEACIEAQTVQECGGRLHLVKRIPGLATSEIIDRIQHSCV